MTALPERDPWWRISYGTRVTAEHARIASVACIVGFAGMVAPLLTLAIPGRPWPVHVVPLIVAVAIGAVESVVLSFDMWRLLRTDFIPAPVLKSLAQVLAAVVAIGLYDYAIGGSHGYYDIVVVLPVLVAGILGSPAYVGVVWIASIGELFGTMEAGHLSASTIALRMSIFGCASLASVGMLREVRDSHLVARNGFDQLVETTEVILRAEGLDEALLRFLPLVATQAETERVDACRWNSRGATLLATWPPAPLDSHVVNFESVPPQASGYTIGELQTTMRAENSTGQLLVLVVDKRRPVWWRRASYESVVRQMTAEFALLIHHTDFLVRLDNLGRTDALTSLANRRELMERFDQEFVHSRRNNTSVTLAMVDLDDFKEYNDTFGHQKGDVALTEFGRLLRLRARASDIVGRYGGEEFCVVLPDTDIGGATRLLEEVALRAQELPTCRPITCSIGVAERGDHPDIASMIRAADDALYEAKAAGRNRIVVAPTTENPSMTHHLA